MHTKCYSYGVAHVPGKEFLAADALSGAPLPSAESLDLVEEVAAFVERITAKMFQSSQRALSGLGIVGKLTRCGFNCEDFVVSNGIPNKACIQR